MLIVMDMPRGFASNPRSGYVLEIPTSTTYNSVSPSSSKKRSLASRDTGPSSLHLYIPSTAYEDAHNEQVTIRGVC